MLERFGPWSSALGDGLSPHLSTFWKRRLALLGVGPSGPPSADAARLAEAGRRRRRRLRTVPPCTSPRPTGRDDAKPTAAGKIYVYAAFKTGPGADDSDKGIFAIDPETSRPGSRSWTSRARSAALARRSMLALTGPEGSRRPATSTTWASGRSTPTATARSAESPTSAGRSLLVARRQAAHRGQVAVEAPGRPHAVTRPGGSTSTARAPPSCRSPRPMRSTTGRPTAGGS